MLKIAIAKGRVANKVSELLLDTNDYRNIINLNSRKLVFVDKNKEITFFLMPMFPYMWKAGGRYRNSWEGRAYETGNSSYEIMDLKTCSCRMVVASPSEQG